MTTTTTARQTARQIQREFEEILANEFGDTFEDEQYIEGPTCSICDAVGHGFPGGGPCPLESPDPMYYAEEFRLGR